MWRKGGRVTMHSSLHSDKRRGADRVQKGPPTRLIKPLRHHRPVSFAALTVRLFNILYLGNLIFCSLQTYWGQCHRGTTWSYFDSFWFESYFRSINSISLMQQKHLQKVYGLHRLKQGDALSHWMGHNSHALLYGVGHTEVTAFSESGCTICCCIYS